MAINKNGHWYTDENVNHYFVEKGQSPKEGWEASKRRKMLKGGKYQVSENGNDYEEVDEKSYKDYEADEEFDETNDDDFGFDEEDDYEKEHFETLDKLDKMNLTDKQKEYFYKELELVENGASETYDNIAQLLDDAENEAFDNEDRDEYDEEVEEKKARKDFEKLNEYTFKDSKMNNAIEKAQANGQTPQQVLDSVSYDLDIEPGTEEFNRLRDKVLREARRNKESGEWEYRKWNIGSDKSKLNEDENNKLTDLKNALVKEGLDSDIVEGWEDYGANMKWKAPVIGETWALYPNEWLDYMNDDITKEELVNKLKDRFKDKIRQPEKDEEDWFTKKYGKGNAEFSEDLKKFIEELYKGK